MNSHQFQVVQSLKAATIFAAVPIDVLASVATAVQEVELLEDEILFAQGDHGTCMYLIVSGLMRVHIGDQTVVELGAGETVGELAAVDPQPRSASVSAVDPATLYRIDQDVLDRLMTDHPVIMRAMLMLLARRLRDTTATCN